MNDLLLPLLIFAAALLYSSVGHGGASAYLAVLALANIESSVMRPSILALNVIVASVSFLSFYRRGWFSWSIFWPLALVSMPLAWFGGTLALPEAVYERIIGAALLFAAYRLWRPLSAPGEIATGANRAETFALGSGIGFLSGLTGVGGGIYLSPLLILRGWTSAKTASAVAAAFIVVNSVAGLIAIKPTGLPAEWKYWAIAALAGGSVGAYLGSRTLTPVALRRTLGVVLAVASIKLLLGT